MSELLPCPFCGGPAAVYDAQGSQSPKQSWYIYCTACGSASPHEGQEKCKAIAHWNTRPPSQPGREAITFWYRNYRGEEGYRRATPISLRFGTSEWHKTPQWLMLAHDDEKDAREFALADMKDLIGKPVLALTKGTETGAVQTSQLLAGKGEL